MDSRAGTPAAGWYPDPARPGTARWWDGSAWTEHSVLIDEARPEPDGGETALPTTAALPAEQDGREAGAAPAAPGSAAPGSAATLSRRERRALDERLGSDPASSPPVVFAPFAAPPAAADDSVVTPDPFEGAAGWAPVAASAASAGETVPAGDPALPAGETAPPVAVQPSAATAAQLADAAPPVPGTAAPAESLQPGWPVLPQLAAPGSALDVASADYEPMARTYPSSAAAPPYLIRGSLPTGTVGAWALALMPIVIGAALAAIAVLVVLPDPNVLLMTTTVLLAAAGFGIGTLVWTILFAALDRRRLRALGHDRRPSVLWAVLLGPVAYFLARIVALRDSGRRAAAPLVGYILALVLVGVGAGVAVGAGAASLTAVSAIGSIESSLEVSLAELGMEYDVMCPSGIELAQGAVMTCEARDDIGVAALVEVTITDPAGEFSYRMV